MTQKRKEISDYLYSLGVLPGAKRTICKSYRSGGRVCADGFIQKPYCRGQAGCLSCGHINPRYLPHCLQDEVPEHLVRDDGSPLFYGGV